MPGTRLVSAWLDMEGHEGVLVEVWRSRGCASVFGPAVVSVLAADEKTTCCREGPSLLVSAGESV